MRGEKLEPEIEALEEEFATLQAAEHEEDSAVTALTAEIEGRRDRLRLTRRALADHEQRIPEKRAELDEAMADHAREVFEQVMQDRHEAAKSLAEAAELLLDRLVALDRLREAARSAWATAESRGKAVGKPLDEAVASDIESEPDVMRESWDRLCQDVRRRINEQFEDELVEAVPRAAQWATQSPTSPRIYKSLRGSANAPCSARVAPYAKNTQPNSRQIALRYEVGELLKSFHEPEGFQNLGWRSGSGRRFAAAKTSGPSDGRGSRSTARPALRTREPTQGPSADRR